MIISHLQKVTEVVTPVICIKVNTQLLRNLRNLRLNKSGLCWQYNLKTRPLAYFAMHLNRSAMFFDDPGDIVEAQSIAFHIVLIACWYSKESLEEFVFIFGLEPDAIVGDF